MTVASIHQNSFVVNVEWSVKFSCSTCTFFLIQNFTNYTVASIYQNSFVMNVKMVSENFLVAHTLLFYNYSHCFFRSMKHLTQASHPYLQRETTAKSLFLIIYYANSLFFCKRPFVCKLLFLVFMQDAPCLVCWFSRSFVSKACACFWGMFVRGCARRDLC